MKKRFGKYLFLLVALTMTFAVFTGCNKEEAKQENGQNEQNTVVETEQKNETEQQEETTHENKTDGLSLQERQRQNTELFGIPQRGDDYVVTDLTDTEDPSVVGKLEELNFYYGLEGYHLIGKGEAGSRFQVHSKFGEALVIDKIEVNDGVADLVFKKAKPGDPFAYEKFDILILTEFSQYEVSFNDGTTLSHLGELHAELALVERDAILLEKLDGNRIKVGEGGNVRDEIFALTDDAAAALETIEVNTHVEYVVSQIDDTIYAIREFKK